MLKKLKECFNSIANKINEIHNDILIIMNDINLLKNACIKEPATSRGYIQYEFRTCQDFIEEAYKHIQNPDTNIIILTKESDDSNLGGTKTKATGKFIGYSINFTSVFQDNQLKAIEKKYVILNTKDKSEPVMVQIEENDIMFYSK